MEFDQKATEADLMNWARAVNDSFLEHHLLFAPPPTSEGYVPDTNAFDEPEPVRMPVDEKAASLTEHVVISIGCERGYFELFQVLVKWYTKLMFIDCANDERFRRLTKHMKYGNDGNYRAARSALERAMRVYWIRRQDMIEIKRLIRQ